MKKMLGLCLIVWISVMIALPMTPAIGSGFSSVSITTDKNTYFAGETMHLTIEGTDSDNNPNDNYIDVYVFVINSTDYFLIFQEFGIKVTRVWNQNIEIPQNAEGTGYINVYDTVSGALLGSKSFSVVGGGVVGGYLTLQQSIYTKSLTFVPGETIHISVHDCAPLGEYTLKITLGTNEKFNTTINVDANGNYFLNYTIPETAPDSPRPDGTRYAVELYNGTTRIDRIRYDVKLYEIYTACSRNAYIPGEVVVVKYAVLYLKNHTPVANEFFGTWYVLTPSGTLLEQPSTFRKSMGEFSFRLGNAAEMGYYTVRTYYNDSATATEPDRWDMDSLSIYCGNLGVYIYSPFNGATYGAGELVPLSLKTYVATTGQNTDIGNLPEVTIKLSIKKGDETLLTKNFVTDYSGYMNYNWQIPDAFGDGTILEFNITASKNDALMTKSVVITVTKPEIKGINAFLEFTKQSYLTGENITLHVRATYTDGTKGNFSYLYLISRDSAGTNLLTMVSSTSPDFTYAPPSNFYGNLWCHVLVSDDFGNSTTVSKSISVEYAIILLSGERTMYQPGDTLKFSYEIISKMMQNPECFVTMRDNYGRTIISKKVSNGSFEVQIPENPADEYTITIVAQESGITVTDYLTISKFSGYEFTVTISPSAYTTNVYKPGETIYITYNLKAREGTPMPQSIKISVGLSTGQADAKVCETKEMHGTISYTLPSNLERGTYLLTVSCQVESTFQGTLYTWTTISVMKDPSAADLNIGGMRAMDLILLTLVLITLLLTIIFFLLLYRRLGRVKQKQGTQVQTVQGPQGPQNLPQQPSPQGPPAQLTIPGPHPQQPSGTPPGQQKRPPTV